MANMNFDELMKMISKMDKKELEEKMAQAQQILNSKDPNAILKQMNNNNKQNHPTQHCYC